MIIAPRLQKINGLLGPGIAKTLIGRYLLSLLLGFINHRGRMPAQQAAWAVADQPRHRANQGPGTAMRRLSPARRGSKNHTRTFYVHEEKRDVRSLGVTRIVFSTKQKPTPDKPLVRDQTKLLLSNVPHFSSGQIVELYTLRWQIERFFKELKSCLGLHQYRFRSFATVEAWVQACLITFSYLEWVRVQGLSRRKVPPRQRAAWLSRRTYGRALAV